MLATYAGQTAALLLLADARLPCGGHAHSWGLEEAAARGRVTDIASLAAFARGRLHTTGLTDAALTAVATTATYDQVDLLTWGTLDAEAQARGVSPALRRASRSLGRQLLRAGRGVWPHPVYESVGGVHLDGPHQPVALGAVAAAAGIAPVDAALASAHLGVAALCSAGVRLLALDPYGVHRIAAELAAEVTQVAAAAAAAAQGPWSALPCPSAPVTEMAAERHALWEVKLFAS